MTKTLAEKIASELLESPVDELEPTEPTAPDLEDEEDEEEEPEDDAIVTRGGADVEDAVSRKTQGLIDAANSELFKNNLKLATHIANAFRTHGSEADVEDRITVAKMALIAAAESFKEEFGVPFGSYASRVIRNALSRNFTKGKKKFAHEIHGHDAFAGNGEEDEVDPNDRYKDNAEQSDVSQSVDRKSTVDIIRQVIGELDERERFVMTGLNQEHPRTLQEMGDELGLSKMMISRIKDQAFAKIRRRLQKLGYIGVQDRILKGAEESVADALVRNLLDSGNSHWNGRSGAAAKREDADALDDEDEIAQLQWQELVREVEASNNFEEPEEVDPETTVSA